MKNALGYLIFWILMGLLTGICCSAQCSTSTPCVPIVITNSFVVGIPNSTATLYTCTANCTEATLNSFISGSLGTSWKSTTFPMTKSPLTYRFPMALGTTLSWAAANSIGGAPNQPPSAIMTLRLPNLVYKGSAGPQ